MKTSNMNKNGFSLAETLVVLAIMSVILSIVMYSYNNLKSKKAVETTVDSINFKLEEAKTNAISGKNGSDFGIQFGTSTYTFFTGSSYNSSNTSNKTVGVNGNVQISKSFANGGSSIVFSRMTGIPQTTGSITVTSLGNSSTIGTITIGNLGGISVIK